MPKTPDDSSNGDLVFSIERDRQGSYFVRVEQFNTILRIREFFLKKGESLHIRMAWPQSCSEPYTVQLAQDD